MLAIVRGDAELLLKRGGEFLTNPAKKILEEIYRQIGSVEEKSGLAFEVSEIWGRVASSKKVEDV